MTTISIDLNNVLALEDVVLREVNSVETYIAELIWFRNHLIDSHINRCTYWKNNVDHRPGLGKLHNFLSQLED